MPRLTPALAVGLLFAGSGALRAQGDGLATACSTSLASGCVTAVATARHIQSRVGLSLFGGTPVPGTASTLGLRMPGTPRVSASARFSLLPLSLPPLLETGAGRATGLLAGAAAQTSVGVFSGFSPAVTVGGLLSLDLIGRVSYTWLPRGRGFRDGGAFGWSAGVRLGLLRESLTLPGLSVTGTYGHTGRLAFGDPGGDGDGYVETPVNDLGATLALSREVGRLEAVVGTAVHRYSGDVAFGFRPLPGSLLVEQEAGARNIRWSGFGSLAWRGPITRFSVEAGWQQTSDTGATDPSVRWSGGGWWIGSAFRLII